jgi:hypothetical protein
MRYFMNRGGRHFEDGAEYRRGTIVPSTKDLVALFGAKFAPVAGPEALPEAVHAPEAPSEPEAAADDEEGMSAAPEAGDSASEPTGGPSEPLAWPAGLPEKTTEVTARFPKAAQLGLRLFRSGRVYLAFDVADLENEMIRDPEVTTIDEVNTWLATLE